MIKIFSEKLVKMGKKYKNLLVFCADYAGEIGVAEFAEAFSERFFNLGLAEANTFSTAAGISVCGKMPIVVGRFELIVGKAFGQIKNNICVPNLNVKIVGISDEKDNDVELMKVLPNMKILVPKNEKELESSFEEMMKEFGPAYLRLSL